MTHLCRLETDSQPARVLRILQNRDGEWFSTLQIHELASVLNPAGIVSQIKARRPQGWNIETERRRQVDHTGRIVTRHYYRAVSTGKAA